MTETGVSVAFTVRAMDAGPVWLQRKVPVDPAIQATELLQQLFEYGTTLLLENIADVWTGRAALLAAKQVRHSSRTLLGKHKHCQEDSRLLKNRELQDLK